MPNEPDPDFVVLHTLRCIGFADESRVGTVSGLGLEVASHLRTLERRGLVENGPEPFDGWGLTEQGREADRQLVAAELDTFGAYDHVHGCYETFLRLNPVLLQVCTDWQLQRVGDSPVINDHSDADYDANVLNRLLRIDDEVQPVCVDLAARLARFGTYGPRLDSALQRALAGDHRYVSDDLESYHNVWFQLHEDLLTTLGIPRGSERE